MSVLGVQLPEGPHWGGAGGHRQTKGDARIVVSVSALRYEGGQGRQHKNAVILEPLFT